jgi:transposase-like protein
MIESPAGLSPKQIEAVRLLLAGRSVEEVADQLGVHRGTIWKWKSLETFQAYYNALLSDIKTNSRDALLSLHEDALATVRRLLKDGSDGVALKAACLVLARVEEQSVGSTDANELVRKQCSTDPLTEVGLLLGPQPDMTVYKVRCKELGIEP